MIAIKRITLTHVRVPLVEPFRISSGAVAEKDGIVVHVETADAAGYGEASPMSGSFYSSDTPESCWTELSERIVPSLLGKSFDSAIAASEFIGAMPGSNFAKTGIETAFWDIEARQQGKPLSELLGGAPKPVESGLAVGLYDNPADMLRAIERYMVDGYKRVKIKIERGRDVELIRAVRGAFGNIPLFVDANGAYDLTDLAVFQTLDEFGLMMFEQPFAGHMLAEMAVLQTKVRTPVCLDESLESEADLLRAIELGSFKIANIKIQRVGGFRNALRIYQLSRDHDIPVWMGTMPELGIGGAQTIAMGTLSGCLFPTDVEASSRWFQDEIISPWLTVIDGMVQPGTGPGLGFAIAQEKLNQYQVATQTFGGAA